MRKVTTTKISRKNLFSLIWERPISKVAPELGLSGNGLAKLCRRHGIPVPERGHWAKLAHGKRVTKPRLPKLAEGQSEEIIIETRLSGRRALEAGMHEPIAALLQAEQQAEPIHVPQSPKPHAIVASWPVPSRGDAAESRRRRIATVLMREIEKRGGIVARHVDERNPSWIDTHRFNATFFGTTIKIALEEQQRMVEIPADPKRPYSYPRNEWQGTGLLRLRFDEYFNVPIQHRWNETAKNRLEDKLHDIIVGLLIALEAEWQRKEQRAEEERRRAEVQLRWLQAEEKRVKEQKRVDALLEDARAWKEAQLIRDYVAAVAATTGSERSSEWIAWAKSVADSIDPNQQDNRFAPNPAECNGEG